MWQDTVSNISIEIFPDKTTPLCRRCVSTKMSVCCTICASSCSIDGCIGASANVYVLCFSSLCLLFQGIQSLLISLYTIWHPVLPVPITIGAAVIMTCKVNCSIDEGKYHKNNCKCLLRRFPHDGQSYNKFFFVWQ